VVAGGFGWLRTVPRSRTALQVDSALGALFLALLLVERWVVAPVPSGELPLATGLGVVLAAALALRRRIPLAAHVLGAVALVAEALTVTPSLFSPYANQILVYSVGRHATRPRAWCGLVIQVVGVAAYFAAVDPQHPSRAARVLFVWLLAWAVGYAIARRRAEQAVARALVRRQAVADERTRIARELHDVLGHTISLMLVQAGAGRRLLAEDPPRAGDLLLGMEQTGRDALTELDRVLGVLREPGDRDADRATPPGVADLAGLAERMRRAGLRVTLRLDPGPDPLPRSLDVSVYRIVQETLTNALRHSEAGSAVVEVRRDAAAPDVLDVEVRDDGRGAPADLVPGRGLLGIRERVALFDGRVEYGPTGRGGFRVHVRLPIPARSPG
jgi:signal transduction histidine kinase